MERIEHKRGSEWIKWDLHLHTPSSFDYGNKNITDEEIIKEIKKRNLFVVAITDHHIIDVKRIKNLQKIAGDKVKILPGIELRTEMGGSESVHIIGIFPEDSDIDSVWDKVKGKLNLTDADIKSVGGDDFITVKLIDACDLIHKCGGLVSIHAGKKSNSVENITNALSHKMATKIDILEHIDIFEVNSLEDINDYKTKVYPHIPKNPPIIICSDNHNIREYETNSNLWVKSIPTFNGLRQILYETGRVSIGEEPPAKAEPSKVIESISISNSGGWFKDGNIELNSGMVSIIGGKGTGKTALLDFLVLASNKDWNIFKKEENSFLKKAQNELSSLKLTLHWGDKSSDECSLEEIIKSSNTSKSLDRVVYLSQGYISTLCSDEQADKLQKQIERVIFQSVSDEEKAIYSNFDDYKNSKLVVVKNKQSEIKDKILVLSDDIDCGLNLLSEKEDVEKSIKKKDKELKGIEKEIEKISSNIKEAKNKKTFKEYQSSNEEKAKLERGIAKLKEDVRLIDATVGKVTNLSKSYKDSLSEINKLLGTLGLKEKISISVLPENIFEVLKKAKQDKLEEVSKKSTELTKIKGKIDGFIKELKFEESKQERLTDLSGSEKRAKEELESLREKKNEIEKAEPKVKILEKEQKDLFCEFFITMCEEKVLLEEIYKPLEDILEKSGEENEKFFRFQVSLGYDYRGMAEKGDVLVDHRKQGNYQNKDKTAIFEDLEKIKNEVFSIDFSSEKDCKELSEKNKDAVENFINSIRFLFDGDKKDAVSDFKIKSQLGSNYSMKDFYNWLFSVDYYTLSYSVEFNGKNLKNLSPGLKGVALLILYLELDKEDNKPILIDQPEENLDNRFIYNTLVKYFRKAKRKRQVIIATHNANLVVNTDSEQVIVANFDKDKNEQTSTIAYVAGAIEDAYFNEKETTFLERKGTREHIIDILEGSEDAFKKREKRYNLQ